MKDKIMNGIKNNKYFVLLFICLALFLLILINVLNGNIVGFDNAIYNFFSNLRADFTTGFFKTITRFADEEILILLAVISLIFIKDRMIGLSIAINLSCSGLINHLLKEIVQRPRPIVDFKMVEEASFSFPSGHAMTSLTFYGLIMYYAYKKIKNKAIRNTICIALSILIFFIGISRIYLGAHYASDVLAGFLCGIVYLVLYITFILKLLEIR